MEPEGRDTDTIVVVERGSSRDSGSHTTTRRDRGRGRGRGRERRLYEEREDVVSSYEERLEVAKWAARIVGGAYAFSRFLACCDLTWASVVLLGGFVSFLKRTDFEWVTVLLLFEAARLWFAAFFSGLLTRGLATHRPSRPTELGSTRVAEDSGIGIGIGIGIGRGPDPRLGRTLFTRIVSLGLQVALIVPPMLISMSLALDSPAAYPKMNAPNLSSSVRIFYVLILFNCFVALGAALSYILAFCLLNWPDHSLLCYFDNVLENILINGRSLVDADRFCFADFAYKLLGRELGRNMSPPMLPAHYKRMLEYLFAVREGEDHLLIYLEYPDALVQQAAASMLGFWVSNDHYDHDHDDHFGLEVSHLVRNLPESLVLKLVRKFGSGQVGWAAADSIHALARHTPHLILNHGTNVPDAVVDAIDPASSRSLVFVRTLVFLVHSRVADMDSPPICAPAQPPLDSVFDPAHLGSLQEKLHRIVASSPRVHPRLRAVSAYLLLLLNSPLLPRLETIVRQRIDTTRGYWYASEVDMLDTLDSYFGPPPGDIPVPCEIRSDTLLPRPRWTLNL